MNCRPGCGACCIAPSISSPIPGMAQGKPTGTRCIQLGDDNRCRIFGLADRPAVCSQFTASDEMCGATRSHAMRFLVQLERDTQPA